MPFIHIKSLPFKYPLDVQDVIERVSRAFARDMHIALEHVSVTWQFFDQHSYAVAGATQKYQSTTSHPVLVDLLIPDFNTSDVVEKMLSVLASHLSASAGVAQNNIFIHARLAQSGFVFDKGQVEHW